MQHEEFSVAHEAKLIAGVGEPAHHIMVDGQCIGYYSAEQLAAAVAKKDAEIAGWKADQRENMQIQVDQHKRIAELEAANLDLRKWVDATGQGLMLERIATLESTLRVAQSDAEDVLLRKLGLDPAAYRTDGGEVNHLKVKAAIRNPNDYPTACPHEWAAAPASLGGQICKHCGKMK